MSEETENLAGYFFDKLKEADRPAIVLNQFYSTVFDQTFDNSLLPFLSKMIRLYGRDLVYLSILDMSDMREIDFKSPIGLIKYFINKRVEAKFKHTEIDNLSKQIEENEKSLNKRKRKVEVKDPFND